MCWSHVAAIIYYITHARYLCRIVRPAEMLEKLFNVEKIEPVINKDNDKINIFDNPFKSILKSVYYL